MPKKIVAANWKMNLNQSSAKSLLDGLSALQSHSCEVVICPSFTLLPLAKTSLSDSMKLGAQNVYPAAEGAFTGEVSAQMLKDFDVKYCIVGHSERRDYFAETDGFIAEKIKSLLANDIIPIFCCGENLEIRENNLHQSFVESQLRNTFSLFSDKELTSIVIAYEPIWAIGTGKTASPQQAEEMHLHIRQVWKDMFGETAAAQLSILYGGSCKADNAESIFSMPNVDGGLIGGASLKLDEFKVIVNACK
jgi:triosephosphate isomerase